MPVEKFSEAIFWAEQVAKKAIERAKEEGIEVITCRSGQTPSGAKHIGNFNDNVRSYFVAKLIQQMGYKARHVQTHDDMDPLRKIPVRMPDLDGRWHELSKEEIKRLSKFVGFPLCRVPDPFGCCKSWAEHFEKVWEEGCKIAGIKMTEYYRNEDLYREGKFNPYIELVFERIEKAREIILEHQRTKTKEYVPFWVICENCGRITGKVVSFDLESKTVEYVCTNRSLAGKYNTGCCGYKGCVSWENGTGKLDWQFEWPAQMHMFNTIVEPFGKDHYEGSWPICQKVITSIYDGKPPIAFVYEMFLINGKKMSARHGNVFTVQDMVRIMEPEIFLYFYTKRPLKQREINLKNLALIFEFEKAERIYFGVEKAKNEKEERNVRIAYKLAWADRPIPKKIPVRIPYFHAAIIAQVVKDVEKEQEVVFKLLRKTGHIKGELNEEEKKSVIERIKRARNWVLSYGPENLRFKPLERLSEGILSKIDEKMKKCIADVKNALMRNVSKEELETLLFDLPRKYEVPVKKFFQTFYEILLGKKEGPRLALLLISLRDFAIKRLEEIEKLL